MNANPDEENQDKDNEEIDTDNVMQVDEAGFTLRNETSDKEEQNEGPPVDERSGKY